MAQNYPQNAASTATANSQPGTQHPVQPQQLQQQQQPGTVPVAPTGPTVIGGGRFDFDDGGTYCGGWHDGKAHGHGICTGPKGQGEYSGSWHYGFEVSGVYKWPSGATYEGQWQNGKRHGLGVEYRGKWVYKGEWTQGYKGRYGVRASLLSNARYEGTWANGLQDGYGSETYADGGTYQGQWLRGMRHGYGVRTSAPYGHSTITKMANSQQNATAGSGGHKSSLQSLDTEGEDSAMQQGEHRDGVRGGFVLVARVSPTQLASATLTKRRNSLTEKATSNHSLTGGFLKGLRLRKQRSTGDLETRGRNQKSMTPSLRSSREDSETRSTGSTKDVNSQAEMGSNASFLTTDGEISDPSTVEVYHGEWKNDKRSGFGVCERSDGLRFEGEWYNNKKYGYGVTTFPDGTREEGKYKNNLLVTNIRKKHLFMMRGTKLRERIESAVAEAHRAQQIALQKSDIAVSRTATARSKSEQADYAASAAQNDSQMAIIIAKQYGGADLTTLGHGSIAPQRRRLSDFSHVRRMRDSQQQGGLSPFDSPNAAMNNNNRQFLDPNEPFGGRRGSFRNQMMGGDRQPFMHQSSPFPQHHQPHPAAMTPSPPPNRFMYPQHSHDPMMNPRGSQTPSTPKEFTQAFSDHFDHYQRNGTPEPSITSARYTPQARFQMMNTPSAGSNYTGYSPTPSPSPTHHHYSNRPPTPADSPSPPPAPMFDSMGRPPMPQQQHQPPPPPMAPSSSNAPSLIQQIPPHNKQPRTMMMNNVNSTNINYSIDRSHHDNSGDNQTSGVRHLRTASLYRSGIKPPGLSENPTGSTGFKRKPSLQPYMAKQIQKPLMSREEASVLSHQQREQRRLEQEYRERLAQNPLLYLWSPNLVNWLNRQKFVILVFLINVSIAYLFIRMIAS